MESYVLTLIIFTPLLGMAILWCLPSQAHDLIKKVALGFTIPPAAVRHLPVFRL